MWRCSVVIVFFLLSLSTSATAQFVSVAHNARSGAMGGCLLPNLEERHIDIGYRQGFMLAGMADKQLSVVWPTAETGVALAEYIHHGNIDYHEQQVSAGYALHTWPWLLVGVNVGYLNLGTSDPGYGQWHWLKATAFAQAAVGRRTDIALMAGTRPWDQRHSYSIHLQLLHRPVEGLLTVLEGELEDCARMRFGMEYSYDGTVVFRAGLSTTPLVGTFGLGFHYQRFTIDIAAAVHQTLGITPHTTLSICF